MIPSRSDEQRSEERHEGMSNDDFPFVIEHYQSELGAGGSFRPAARLLLTSALRTSGLWSTLPPDELRDLMLLLTFLSPNGRVQPTLPELAGAMQASHAQTRARYAAPRAEVEADIARRMGWGAPAFEDDLPEVAEEKRALYDKLLEQGMSKSQALEVLNRFDLAVVRRQCDWMPYRAAKNPSRYLQAAIENDYEAPVAVRQASMKGIGATADDQ